MPDCDCWHFEKYFYCVSPLPSPCAGGEAGLYVASFPGCNSTWRPTDTQTQTGAAQRRVSAFSLADGNIMRQRRHCFPQLIEAKGNRAGRRPGPLPQSAIAARWLPHGEYTTFIGFAIRKYRLGDRRRSFTYDLAVLVKCWGGRNKDVSCHLNSTNRNRF